MSTAKTSENASERSEFAPNTTFRALEPPTAVVFVVLLLVLILFGLIRYRLRDVPLERDEGEYAYSGQLLLQGIPPYQLAYNMKLPGIYVAYAAVMKVFGETAAGIHLGLLVVNAVTLVLLYCLVTRLFGRLAGTVAACSWGLLSTSTSVLGFEAHATNFVVLPAILGIWLLVCALGNNSLWLLLVSGVMLGIAVLMKQHGIFLVLFCLFYIFFNEQSGTTTTLRRGAAFAVGAALPYGITCALLYKANVFPQFWFWTVSYAGEYSKMGLRRAIHEFFKNSASVTAPAASIWVLAAFGLTAQWWSGNARRHAKFVFLLLFCSFLSLCPGAYFRPHYFILILPVIAMLTGVGVSAATEKFAEHFRTRWVLFLPGLVFLICFGVTVFVQRQPLFLMSPLAVFESTYPESPFFATAQVADYVKTHTTAMDRIAVLGSEPEIYFYSQRHSATGYLYMYSLIVRQKYTARMREELLSELANNKPEYIVYVDVWDSWGERRGVAQAELFLARLQQFMDDGYEREGVADIGENSQYVWGDAVKNYQPRSSKVIYVLRRKRNETAP
jgi:hypothetical protein